MHFKTNISFENLEITRNKCRQIPDFKSMVFTCFKLEQFFSSIVEIRFLPYRNKIFAL